MKKTGIELIAEERQRQIEVEGWTPEHDAEHTDESLSIVASLYAMPSKNRYKTIYKVKDDYPVNMMVFFPEGWDIDYWKPTPDNRIKELVKAGALIAAELDRMLSE